MKIARSEKGARDFKTLTNLKKRKYLARLIYFLQTAVELASNASDVSFLAAKSRLFKREFKRRLVESPVSVKIEKIPLKNGANASRNAQARRLK